MSETGTRAGQDTDRRDSLMLLCLPAGPLRARQHEHSAMPDTVNPGPSGHGRESGFPGPPSPGTPACSCSSLIRPLMPKGPLPSPAEAKERTDNPVFRVAAASHETSTQGFTLPAGHIPPWSRAAELEQNSYPRIWLSLLLCSLTQSWKRGSQTWALLIGDSCQEADAVRKLPPQGVLGLWVSVNVQVTTSTKR